MRDEYPLKGKTKKIDIELEGDVVDTLEKMHKHSKFTVSEIVNTAVKRFIAGHKDFLPAEERTPKN